MGIPSYYKRLTEKVKGILSKSRPDQVERLYFDFNCLIYYCARRPNSTLPPYPGVEEQQIEWENQLIQDCLKYVVQIWHEVGSPKQVSLCLDGVVPMAKIRQQRLRRFKSVWLAKKEVDDTTGPRWDTNCITPGTAFMRRLGNALKDLSTKRPGWSVSTTDEPGEGEHKIMKHIRDSDPNQGPCIIYGLDADLILLTLLNAKGPMYLLREDSELGVDSLGEEQFSYFSLEHLKQVQWPDLKGETLLREIREYVAAMSFLGNDFLPHSLSIKIRDNGHTVLLSLLKELHSTGAFLLQEHEGRWILNQSSVSFMLSKFKENEEEAILHTVKKKIQLGGHASKTMEGIPSEWIHETERPIVLIENGRWSLRSIWKRAYSEWLMSDSESTLAAICKDYFIGLQWIVDYYTGQKPVNMKWYFSRYIPPLWSDLYDYAQRNSIQVEAIEDTSGPIQPQEQLAMVLPMESWHLIEDKRLRLAPSRIYGYWPVSFGFFSAGRSWLWECEPLIPILSVVMLRHNNAITNAILL